MSEKTYYEQRLEKLGITEEINSIKLLEYDVNEQKNVLKPRQVFRRHEKGIEIIVYTLKRELITYKGDTSRYSKHYSIIRLEVPMVKDNGDTMKYQLPKGVGSHPFFPPHLVDKFEKKEHIPVLFLIEGYFKAFKGAMHGIDIVGLPSITHMKDKATGALHPEILELIQKCDVRDVVWLTDGDCLDISRKAKDGNEKELVDLRKRPMNFFSSISTFQELLKDYNVQKWFMHVDTDGIRQEHKDVPRDDIKGLDDVMVTFPGSIPQIVKDIHTFSRPKEWFKSFQITFGTHKVYEYFKLTDINQFYRFHVERQEMDGNKEFLYGGTRYKYDSDKHECMIIVPGDARNYFRVGDDYFKNIIIPNKYGQDEHVFVRRQKTTISDDHVEGENKKKAKDFFKHIPKFEAFCNVPSHTQYQRIIKNCYNVYNPLDFKASEEDCTVEDCGSILSFIKHIFGQSIISFNNPKKKIKEDLTTLDLALDYLQLLYHKPAEKLPILCLVSKENNTGKSTYGKLLKLLFGGNCAIVGNQDLAGDFNKHWASKTIVICDEAKIDKQVVIEKVKALSTADKIMMNAKGQDHVEIDCFIKFIFITNNEENFINIHEEDIRYWVIKVPTIKEENPSLLDMMIEEIPAFMSFLNRRTMKTEKLNRMWFHPELLQTEALKKVREYSRSTVEKEIREYLRDMFFVTGKSVIYMERNDINKEVFNNKYEKNYIDKTLREKFKVEPYWVPGDGTDLFGAPKKKFVPKRYSYTRLETQRGDRGKENRIEVEVDCGTGRPYVFRVEDFLSAEEISTLSPEKTAMDNSGGLPAPPATEDIKPKDDLPF